MPSEEAAPIGHTSDRGGTGHTISKGGTGVRRWDRTGIAMGSLIKNDGHISNTVNNMGPYHALRGWVNGLGYSLDERLMPYLELVGFGSVALVRIFDLQYDLISALVEHWRTETNTFHLPCGECTVTLEDVALQLGLPIYGSAVTGVSTIIKSIALCYSLLGVLLDNTESKFTSLRFSWLTEQKGFPVLAMLYHELCQKYIAVWDNRMARKSTVVPPHIYRLEAYEPVPDIKAKLEPEPEPEPMPELE
ncbi:hypothetical protein PVK06_017478 [Gossypium arboreum]|uniref:Aminotransferase-like plant mobile domain-containing protein n=1 Tax=Gossypium arboreum TaxID=29729 RepID=A0ABR0Q372_GOSAR|nr:hypothetical protein PVK06_017478 [Gossypium arboreum]